MLEFLSIVFCAVLLNLLSNYITENGGKIAALLIKCLTPLLGRNARSQYILPWLGDLSTIDGNVSKIVYALVMAFSAICIFGQREIERRNFSSLMLLVALFFIPIFPIIALPMFAGLAFGILIALFVKLKKYIGLKMCFNYFWRPIVVVFLFMIFNHFALEDYIRSSPLLSMISISAFVLFLLVRQRVLFIEEVSSMMDQIDHLEKRVSLLDKLV
jgi:hypothetical protein